MEVGSDSRSTDQRVPTAKSLTTAKPVRPSCIAANGDACAGCRGSRSAPCTDTRVHDRASHQRSASVPTRGLCARGPGAAHRTCSRRLELTWSPAPFFIGRKRDAAPRVPLSLFSAAVHSLTEVPAPSARLPTDAEFYTDAARSKVNLDFLKQHLTAEGRLTESQAMFLVTSATEILKSEATLIDVDAPLTGAARSPACAHRLRLRPYRCGALTRTRLSSGRGLRSRRLAPLPSSLRRHSRPVL